MGAGAILAIQLATAALQHAGELSQLVLSAQAEGRDVSPAEIAGLRAKAVASIDALEAAAKAP